jgi:hypothetical protein
MKKNILKTILLGLFTCFFTTSLLASKPMWKFTPVSGYPPAITVSENEVKTIKYIVTNQSKKTRTLMMVGVAEGVKQMTNSAGDCGNPFVLPSGRSCVLSLQVTGNQLRYSITEGPKVCPQGPNGAPSKFECYTPSKKDSLNIIAGSTRLTLSAIPSVDQVVGLPYTQVNLATGGTRPYTYAVTAGVLPQVTELLNECTVYGILRTKGIYAYIITVTDAKGATASADSSGFINLSVLDVNFPYGTAPQGNVCVGQDYYATPETMLGSWAMQEAVEHDHNAGELPEFLYQAGIVYAVGTASIAERLGIPDCDFGCDEINGYCFAIQFNDPSLANNPFMIFQSVDTAALENSFDIYLPGGGSGAFPGYCTAFWGTDGSVDWNASIQNTSTPGDCLEYFNHFQPVHSDYVVIYNGMAYPARQTLIDACNFAHDSGYNRKNFSNISVVPVTCPTALSQVTGIKQNQSVNTIGTKPIQTLNTLTLESFVTNNVALTCTCESPPCRECTSTTQMQDCKTPSAGYCNSITPGTTVPNYEASISATLQNPILVKLPPSVNYCFNHPSFVGSFCSWDDGATNPDPGYCSQSISNCLRTDPEGCSVESPAQWCTCQPGGTLANCTSS